jgi:hypothetical protein
MNIEKSTAQMDIIALPPLKMVLMYTKNEHVSKAALAAAIRKIAPRSVIVRHQVDLQVVRKLIKHLEEKL